MLSLIHGDDIQSSRQYLNSVVLQSASQDTQVIRLEAASLTREDLIQALESRSLFSNHQLVVIENLFSRLKSINQKNLVSEIALAKDASVLVWEPKTLSATDIAAISPREIKLFAIKPAIFSFLDSLGGDKTILMRAFHKALDQDPPEKLLPAIASRLHLLLQAVIQPEALSIQGFYRTKILSQSRRFTPRNLQELIEKLLEVDYLHKTGGTSLSLAHSLEILFLSL